MALFVFDCPHCNAKKMSGAILSHYVVPAEHLKQVGSRPIAFVHSVCGECMKPVSGQLTSNDHRNISSHHGFNNMVQQAIGKPASIGAIGFGTDVIRTPAIKSDVPRHLPETVRKAFRSAELNRGLSDCEDAAATMYRRAIDVAIKEKHPELRGTLHTRISTLAENGTIPQALKDWGDQIRWIGNDGAHEPEGVTQEDVKALRGFADAFLRYFISLPFDVALRRGQIDESGNLIEEPESSE